MVFSLSPLLLALSFLGASVTGSSASQDTVSLGTAANFAILTKAGVTTTGVTSVNDDVGTSPIAATAITGFGLIMDSTNTFSTSNLVTGKIYAADYKSPTPSEMTTAISDMETAHTDAAGRQHPDFLERVTGGAEGQIFAPGLYKWAESNVVFTKLTFEGDANAVWILQISNDLTVNGDIILSGGALAKNIFWQVSGKTVLETNAHMEGIILCATSIDFKSGSSLDGAALAQTAVTLDTATIVKMSASDDYADA